MLIPFPSDDWFRHGHVLQFFSVRHDGMFIGGRGSGDRGEASRKISSLLKRGILKECSSFLPLNIAVFMTPKTVVAILRP